MTHAIMKMKVQPNPKKKKEATITTNSLPSCKKWFSFIEHSNGFVGLLPCWCNLSLNKQNSYH